MFFAIEITKSAYYTTDIHSNSHIVFVGDRYFPLDSYRQMSRVCKIK